MEALERQFGQKNGKMNILWVLSAMLAIFTAKIVRMTAWSRHPGQELFLAQQLGPAILATHGSQLPSLAPSRQSSHNRFFFTCTWLEKNTSMLDPPSLSPKIQIHTIITKQGGQNVVGTHNITPFLAVI